MVMRKAMVTGFTCVAGAFALVALHARRIQFGYELARLKSRQAALSREVERLRYECAAESSPVETLRNARLRGLDLHPPAPSRTGPAARRPGAREPRP